MQIESVTFLKSREVAWRGKWSAEAGSSQHDTKLSAVITSVFPFYSWDGDKHSEKIKPDALFKVHGLYKCSVKDATPQPSVFLCTVVAHSEHFSRGLDSLPDRLFYHLLPGVLLSSVSMGSSLGSLSMMYWDLVRCS